jgi:hypothetical protein
MARRDPLPAKPLAGRVEYAGGSAGGDCASLSRYTFLLVKMDAPNRKSKGICAAAYFSLA